MLHGAGVDEHRADYLNSSRVDLYAVRRPPREATLNTEYCKINEARSGEGRPIRAARAVGSRLPRCPASFRQAKLTAEGEGGYTKYKPPPNLEPLGDNQPLTLHISGPVPVSPLISQSASGTMGRTSQHGANYHLPYKACWQVAKRWRTNPPRPLGQLSKRGTKPTSRGVKHRTSTATALP